MFDTGFYATFKESFCEEHYSIWYTAQRVGDRKWSMPLTESQLIAIEEHGCYWGAEQADANMQNSPLMESLREKGGQYPILEVYYFHIS